MNEGSATTSAVILLADGFEEMEAVILADTLRRGKWRVALAGVTGMSLTGSRGVRVLAEVPWRGTNHEEFDVMILPGGREGTTRLASEESVLEALRERASANKWIAAVCAAPLVLKAAGVLNGRRFTSHPSVKDEISLPGWENRRVVADGHLVTSQGPGTCFELALELLRLLNGRAAAEDAARGLILPSTLAGG